MSFIDHYKLLGVHPGSTGEEIKTAYRKLSKKFHPDLNEGDIFFEERFKDIQAAYDTLSDKSRRAAYQRQYNSFYQPADSSNSVDTGFHSKREYRLKPVLLLIPVIVIATAIFFTERIENKPQPSQNTNYAIVENADSRIRPQNREESFEPRKANFRIVLHQYTDYDTAHKTFLQLLAYGYPVIFSGLQAGKYQIAMPFDKPLADTAMIKDSVESLFETKCSVSY